MGSGSRREGRGEREGKRSAARTRPPSPEHSGTRGAPQPCPCSGARRAPRRPHTHRGALVAGHPARPPPPHLTERTLPPSEEATEKPPSSIPCSAREPPSRTSKGETTWPILCRRRLRGATRLPPRGKRTHDASGSRVGRFRSSTTSSRRSEDPAMVRSSVQTTAGAPTFSAASAENSPRPTKYISPEDPSEGSRNHAFVRDTSVSELFAPPRAATACT